MKNFLLSILILLTPLVAQAVPVSCQYQTNAVMRSSTLSNLSDLRTFANVAASSTDGVLVAGIAGKKIRVTAVAAIAGGTATSLTFNTKSTGAGVAVSPTLPNNANGGEVLPFNPAGWLETNYGESLTVTTGAGATTGILITYIAY